MSSKGKCILKKRKEMLHEKLNQIADESRNIIELIHDIQIRATSIVSDLDLETDEREFLLKYPTASKKLEEWQGQISRISYDLDVLVCEENRREPEELNTTSTTSQVSQKEVHYKVEKVSSADEEVRVWTIPCPIQENDILDMSFVSGDSPHDFWLRFYSTKELKEISSSFQKLVEANKLQPLKSSEIVADVCVCNGSDYFRGRVISQWTDSPSYMIRNVDSGAILKVEKSKIYRLSEELAKFPVQAINCCLEGVLGDPALWDVCVVKLFHQVMEDSSLVVTICSVPTETCSRFVVKVDAHNEMRAESKIDLSSWITYSVLPTLAQMSTKKSADTLKLLFDFLRPKAELENTTTNDCSSESQDVERKENKDSKNVCVKDNANSFSNTHIEKSNVQQQTSNAEEQCDFFMTLNSNPVHAMSPHKEKSNIQEPLSNTGQQCSTFVTLNTSPGHALFPHKDKSNSAQQCSSFPPVHAMPSHKQKSKVQQQTSNAVQQCSPVLSLNSMPGHAMPLHKDKSNIQQWPPSIEQQSSPFLSLRNSSPLYPMHPSTSQYVPHFLPYQNPPMLVRMNPTSPPVYPYPPQRQPSLLGMHPLRNPGPPVTLQKQNQPQPFQHHMNSSMQNRFQTKEHTSRRLPTVSYTKSLQSNMEDTKKGRDYKSHISSEDKQKEPTVTTNTASVIKQTPSAETLDFSGSKQEMSSAKVNSRNTNEMTKGSLRYPNLSFEAGKRYQAFVVHINDPDDFYIHVACVNTAFVETLDQKMTKNYKTCSVKLKNKDQAKIMLYESWCAVFYEDEQLWHRGKVIDWKDDNSTALEVEYVDYGEVREVDLSMIKPLKEEYTKLPICATRCRLANIHPPQLQENNKQNIWPSETIELFKVLTVKDKLHTIVVTNTSSDPISVLLVTEDNVVLNRELLDMEYAIAFKPIEFDPNLPIQLITENEEDAGKDSSTVEKPTENCQKKAALVNGRLKDSGKTAGDSKKEDDQENSLQNWDPMADDFFSVDNTEYRDDENACYAVSGYISQDEQRICKFFAANGRCFKGVTCTKEHSMSNPDGWTTDRESVLLNPFSNLVLPPVGTSVTIEVTAIYRVNMFYAHILWEGRLKEEEEETLLTLNKSINRKDNISKMKRPQIIPAVGQLILARFIADGNSNFFRARVIDTSMEENKVQVVYIDYGNTEWVSEKDIREMEPQYLHLPFQALECYIGNVNPKTDSEEALLDVSDLILGKQLLGTLISKNILGHAEVELWYNDQKIADKLIEKGYADYRESPLFLTEDASLIPG